MSDVKPLKDQPGPMPTNKVLGATGGAGIGVVIVWILCNFTGNCPDAAVASSISALFALVAGWFVRDRE